MKNNSYGAEISDTINLRLKLPPININENWVQRIKPLKLKEINLIKLQGGLKDVNKFNFIDTSILAILIIIFVYYNYKKPKNNVKVNIELKLHFLIMKYVLTSYWGYHQNHHIVNDINSSSKMWTLVHNIHRYIIGKNKTFFVNLIWNIFILKIN